jgi:hypothetical protein
MRGRLRMVLMLGTLLLIAAASYLWMVRGNAIVLDLGANVSSFLCP